MRSRGVSLLLDPLGLPAAFGPRGVGAPGRLRARRAVVILKPDHIRDVDLIVRWYGARALGQFLYWRGDVPQTELEPVRPR